MDAGEPRIFFPVAQLNNSGLCGFEKQKTASSSNSDSDSNSNDSTHPSRQDKDADKKSSASIVGVPYPGMLISGAALAFLSWFL
ncbi:hypothetical protein V6Z88_001973 [Aspergillus fumigatus]